MPYLDKQPCTHVYHLCTSNMKLSQSGNVLKLACSLSDIATKEQFERFPPIYPFTLRQIVDPALIFHVLQLVNTFFCV